MITNALSPINGDPPSSNATAAASPAQPAVATQRGYGWRAATASANAAAAGWTLIPSRTTWSTMRATCASRVRSVVR